MKIWKNFTVCVVAALLMSACNQDTGTDETQNQASATTVSSAVPSSGTISDAQELPTINVGYIFTTNHTPFQVAMAKGEEYKQNDSYLKPLIPKEKYQFVVDGKPVAQFDVIVNKSGSETSTLFAQKRMDLAMASITAVMAGIDKGVPMKIVSPLVLVGGAVVVDKDSALTNWAEFVAQAKQGKQTIKIGYHSPTSAPKIILEGALKHEGLKVSSDPNDSSAQVLLVDLKETSNMLPALASKQVDAVVGPEPLPQTAQFKKIGKVISQLRDLPPDGQWQGFPCCVIVASDELIATRPELVRQFVHFMSGSSQWCNNNRAEAGAIAADWIGLPPEVGKASTLEFISDFSDNWKQGAGGYMNVLNQMGYFKGQLKDKSFDQAQSLLIAPEFVMTQQGQEKK